MVMTEKEASTKTCPMLWYCVNHNQVYESNFSVYAHCMCVCQLTVLRGDGMMKMLATRKIAYILEEVTVVWLAQ